MRSETAALVLSAAAALVIGAVGVAAAVATGSRAILLDGLFNLCFFVTALFTLRVARLLTRPDDERYPFGYLYFEPLINTVKGLLILGVSLFALVDAAIALSPAAAPSPFGPALAYAAFATARLRSPSCSPCAARGAQVASPLVQADVENWTVNAADLRRRLRRLLPRAPACSAPAMRGRRPPRRPGDGRPRHPRLHRRAGPHGRRAA